MIPFHAFVMILVILGMTVAVVVLFCIAAAELWVGHPLFEEHRAHFALALGGTGVVLLSAGLLLARRRNRAKDAGKLFVLFDLRYWGPVLALLGAITLYFNSLNVSGLVGRLMALLKRPPAAVVAAREPVPINAPPVVFPVTKLQGIIFRTNHPVVLIRGQPYGVGERVGRALVKEITREGVTLELSNELKTILLGGDPVTNAADAALAPVPK